MGALPRPQGRILLGHGLAERMRMVAVLPRSSLPHFDESGPPEREGRWTGRSHSFSCSSSHWGSWDRFNKTPSAPGGQEGLLGPGQDTLLSWGRRPRTPPG